MITADDAASGAGCTLLQIFQKCESHPEAAAYECAIRDLVSESARALAVTTPVFLLAGIVTAALDFLLGSLSWANSVVFVYRHV